MNLEATILADDLVSESQFYFKAGSLKSQLIEGFKKGKTPGETTFFKCLDDILTMRPGFLYGCTGWPGSGKSEFITQLSVLQAHFKSRKIAIYSPESYPVDEFIDTIIHCKLGQTTDKRFPEVCNDIQYSEAIDWVDKNYCFCDWPETPDCATIIKSFQHLYESESCRIFVVDPFNSINEENENIALGLKKNLTAFKRFAAQNKAIVILVEHPKTPTDTKEFDMIPGPRHMFGGTMWWNKVDVLFSVHRPNREDKNDHSVIIKVWKVKKQELNGRPGEQTMFFDIKTKRYYQSPYMIDHPMTESDIKGNYKKQEKDEFDLF